ncbi:ABC transporter ATP-binding protein [Spirochaeta africana]|uniref:ABC-type transport system involved in resistance to organic solvents, ATPase component n=1 Tax=Spirochaeta africana (strain ATCC 700263 / DSM 8902 / Z-7692) TaxID=889378 RepID=H9UKN9_SPIAZ|nr:ATP-binding cassette domain-containing protein [Spirochaeta africana]AFG38082.1 ABC-type transport system involved in resistance to organic solvents, ATPase component [Spirochaeta africana DSM 8902]
MLQTIDLRVVVDGISLLDGVSTSFAAGKVSVIIGSSGSGKSLLLKTAAGIHPPSSGSVRWQGTDLAQMSETQLVQMRRNWGFMFQDSALWSNMSLYENLALPVRFHNPDLSEDHIQQLVRAAASELGFPGILQNRPAAFSAGMQKMASFLRAVINDPGLLFLDEPSTFIDRSGFQAIFRVLQRYRRQGRTILMVTHDIDLARNLGDELYIIRKGQLAAHGPLQELLYSARSDIQQELQESFQQGEQT